MFYRENGQFKTSYSADQQIFPILQDRVMFAADYPMLSYERLVKDWRAEGYTDAVLDKVFHRNAERFLDGLGVQYPSNNTGKS